MKSYGTEVEFLTLFSPSKQSQYSLQEERCVTGKAPTLSQLKASYGENIAETWLVPQLFDLSEYCGCKEKISEGQIRELSRILAATYHYLKVTEFMLFFFRFKQGRYGKFYGAVDPLVITSAMLEFIRERSQIIDKIESEKRKQDFEEWKKKAISRDEYLRLYVNNPEKGQN